MKAPRPSKAGPRIADPRRDIAPRDVSSPPSLPRTRSSSRTKERPSARRPTVWIHEALRRGRSPTPWRRASACDRVLWLPEESPPVLTPSARKGLQTREGNAQAAPKAGKRALDRCTAESRPRRGSGTTPHKGANEDTPRWRAISSRPNGNRTGGGGGNRTHVRKTRPKSVYVCSSRFKVSPDRLGRKHSDDRASLAKSRSRSARHLTAP